MKTLVTHIDSGNAEHKTVLESLFNEYTTGLTGKFQSKVISRLFELSYFHGFICFVDDKPAGFAVCFESYSTYRDRKIMNIHDFMVSDSYRGQGLGKVQLNGIEQYCRDNNYLKITLEVDDDNLVAKKLYSACNYEDYRIVLKGLHHWQKYFN